jgi:hypothetical protein
MKELLHRQRTYDRSALLRRILNAAGDIQTTLHVLEDVTTSVIRGTFRSQANTFKQFLQ